VLVSLLNEKTKEIAEKLATDFELYYADIEEILNYNFFTQKIGSPVSLPLIGTMDSISY